MKKQKLNTKFIVFKITTLILLVLLCSMCASEEEKCSYKNLDHPDLQTKCICIEYAKIKREWSLESLKNAYEESKELTKLELCECRRYMNSVKIYKEYNDASEVMEPKLKKERKKYNKCVESIRNQ